MRNLTMSNLNFDRWLDKYEQSYGIAGKEGEEL